MNLWNIFTQRTFTSLEKLSLTKYKHLGYPTKSGQNFLEIWLFLILSRFVLKKTHTWRQKLQSGLGGMYRYQFLFRQIWSKKPTFLYNINPPHLVLSFITVVGGSDTQSKAQMKLNFFENDTKIKMKLCNLLEQLNQRHNRGRNSDGLCRWLYRWHWGTRPI